MKKIPPRDVPARDEFYMGMAFWAAAKSKDPNTQVGAFIISFHNEPLGWGYNGPPPQIPDTAINWDRPDKYDYIAHAEENAIDFACGSLDNATIYVTAKPCVKCTLRIVKSGIKKAIYYQAKNIDNASMLANEANFKKSEEIAKLGMIQLIQFNGNLNWMRDRMKWMESKGVFD